LSSDLGLLLEKLNVIPHISCIIILILVSFVWQRSRNLPIFTFTQSNHTSVKTIVNILRQTRYRLNLISPLSYIKIHRRGNGMINNVIVFAKLMFSINKLIIIILIINSREKIDRIVAAARPSTCLTQARKG
jgi:hypothetical protein